MKERIRRICEKEYRVMTVVLLLVIYASAGYVYHGIQVKQGVGLYLSMQLGKNYGILYDLLMDAVRLFTIFFACILPAILSKRRLQRCFVIFKTRIGTWLYDMTLLYLSFMPVTNLAGIVHYFDAGNTIAAYEPTLHWGLSYMVVIFLYIGIQKLSRLPNGPYIRKALNLLLLIRVIFRVYYLSLIYW